MAVKSVPGDVNMDGALNITDAVLMQKWLLAVPDTELKDWKAADCNADNQLNAIDLTMLKQLLLTTEIHECKNSMPCM